MEQNLERVYKLYPFTSMKNSKEFRTPYWIKSLLFYTHSVKDVRRIVYHWLGANNMYNVEIPRISHILLQDFDLTAMSSFDLEKLRETKKLEENFPVMYYTADGKEPMEFDLSFPRNTKIY